MEGAVTAPNVGLAEEGGRGTLAPVSVIVPVTERPRDLADLYRTFSAEFEAAGRVFEFVFAVEPWARSFVDALGPLIEAGEPVRVVELGQTVGESALLDAAASVCTSPILVTLPAYLRVQPGALEALVAKVEAGADLGNPETLYPGDRWNPDGYFEQPDIHAINMPLIHGPWGRLAYFFLPSQSTIIKRGQKMSARIKNTAALYIGV